MLPCQALAHEIRDGFVQLPVGEGFVEEAIRAPLHRLHRRRLVCQRRDHQDPHRGLEGDELTDALDAVHARHGEIHGHHVRVGLLEQLEGLEPVGGRAHQLQVLELLRTFDAPAHDVRVVDDHQLEGSFAVAVHRCSVAVAHERRRQAPQATAVLTAWAAGRTILKRVKRPGWVLTPILPPSAYTLRATTSMPTPRPASMDTSSWVEKPGRKISAMAARVSMPRDSSSLISCLRTAAALSASVAMPAPSSSNTSS